MLTTLFIVSLGASSLENVPTLENGGRSERLKLQVGRRTDLGRMTVVASTKKQELNHKLEQERDLKSLASAPPCPVGNGAIMPEIATGYEEIYLRFINGKLIYKKDQPDQVVLPIAQLINPLEGKFDLSQCGDTALYLSIATGYKKAKNPANANKTEIWFTPRFLIERNDITQFIPIMTSADWPSAHEVGIFWSWGGGDVANNNYDYLTTKTCNELSTKNLYENWGKAWGMWHEGYATWRRRLLETKMRVSCFILELR
jgi:hypothetical protein